MEYCDSSLPIACFTKSILGPLSTLLLITILCFSRHKHEPQGSNLPSITCVHFVKLLLLLILTSLPLANLALILFLKEEPLYITSLMSFIFPALNWLINLPVLRSEYKKTGYTSRKLRGFWFLSLIFELASIFLLAREMHKGFTKAKILSFAYISCLFFLNIFGYAKIEDSPEIDYESYMKIRSQNESLFDGGKGINDTKLSPDEVMEKYMDGKRNKKDDILSQDFEISWDFNPSFDEVENIGIAGYEEAIRSEKATIVYQIMYLLNKVLLNTKRSYTEFHRLYTKTQDNFPKKKLPPFPSKKGEQESLKPDIIQDRKAKFEQILIFICENKLYTRYLFEFLKPEEELPRFAYIGGRESLKLSFIPKPDPEPSNQVPLLQEKIVPDQEKSKDRSLSYVQPLKAKKASFFGKPPQDPKRSR